MIVLDVAVVPAQCATAAWSGFLHGVAFMWGVGVLASIAVMFLRGRGE